MSDMPAQNYIQPRYALFASAWAIGTVTLLILIKGYAYWQSDSVAVLATLTDSLTDEQNEAFSDYYFGLRDAVWADNPNHTIDTGKFFDLTD